MSNRNYLLVFLVLLGLFESCKTTGVILPKVDLKEMSPAKLIGKMNDQNDPISWVDGRASVTLQIQGKLDKFSSQVRIKTDSLFLANGKKVSVEGGRLQISRDSFFLLNRVNKSVEIRAYEHVAKIFDIPFQFDELMNVVLARPLNLLDPEKLISEIDQSLYKLNYFSETIKISYSLDPVNFDIVKMTYANRVSGQAVEIVNEDFKLISGIRFPHLRTFRFEGGQGRSISLKVKFSKLELNVPKKIQFKVPPGYTLLD